MRVLIVTGRMDIYGGAELLIVRLINYLQRSNINVLLLTTFIAPEIRKDLLRTKIVIAPTLRYIPNSFNLNEIISLCLCIKKLKGNFDVINVHNYPSEISVVFSHNPVVWMCNEPSLYLFSKSETFLPSRILHKLFLLFERVIAMRFIKAVVVSDESNAARFEKIYQFKPSIINYGIDYEFFSKKSKNRFTKKFNNNFTLLHVGMLTPLKNQIASVKAIEKLKNEIPNIKLILAGGGDEKYRAMLQKYIKARNLERYIVFTGHINREYLRELYYVCDVLLHPIKSQGGWLAPFECMCAEKPVIVSSEFTASNIIRDECLGIVTDEYEKAIKFLYAKTNYDTGKGKRYVKENLSWDKFGKSMTMVFDEVAI